MSDRDSAPDPIDKAYVQAEAALSDEAAREARRARLLAAVARAPATAVAASLPPGRRSAWRRGGWLAAASVAGLGVFIATQVYQPVQRQTQIASTPPAAANSATRGPPASPAPHTPAPSAAPAPWAVTATPEAAKPAPTSDSHLPSSPPPPPLAIAPPPPLASFPVPMPPPRRPVVAETRDAPAPDAGEAGRLSAGAGGVVAQDAAVPAARRASPPAFAAAPATAPPSRAEASLERPTDLAVRLRAAAAGGRISEMEALLAQGAPVDAPDADGETALMKSIEADHPDAAALLRRHGASLERDNHAGDSARDMAEAKGDAALNQAVGLGP
jgi:hypothetical protein